MLVISLFSKYLQTFIFVILNISWQRLQILISILFPICDFHHLDFLLLVALFLLCNKVSAHHFQKHVIRCFYILQKCQPSNQQNCVAVLTQGLLLFNSLLIQSSKSQFVFTTFPTPLYIDPILIINCVFNDWAFHHAVNINFSALLCRVKQVLCAEHPHSKSGFMTSITQLRSLSISITSRRFVVLEHSYWSLESIVMAQLLQNFKMQMSHCCHGVSVKIYIIYNAIPTSGENILSIYTALLLNYIICYLLSITEPHGRNQKSC